MKKEINKRQEIIINLVEKGNGLSLLDIKKLIPNEYKDTSDVTFKRDLSLLTDLDYIRRIGKGRAVKYEISPVYILNKTVHFNEYFKIPSEQRKVIENFNFEVLEILNNVFTEDELKALNNLNKKYTDNINRLSSGIKKREFERLLIDLSWKSSQIEGNTYSLLETEALIKQRVSAQGKTKEETQMILNHKECLNYIQKNKDQFKEISIRKIEDIHSLLIDNLCVGKGLRKFPVGISGTKYKPLDNPYQIKESLENICKLINNAKDCFTKAFLALILISYLQPFEDGNKRTSRLTANALLMAYDACPISYKVVDEVEYKKAILLFYEQNIITYIKDIFIRQFEFSVNNYFLT